MGAYRSLKGQYYPTHTRLSSGGEGTVYTLVGHDDLAAKIYNSSIFKTEEARKMREKKLRAMLRMNIKVDPDGVTRIAWPQDILYDSNGNLAGFTMPKVNADYKIYDIYRGGKGAVRDQIYPDYTWKYSVQFAYHLAWLVDYLHSYNIVIADFNQNNIVVDTKANTILLIDCDSFDITYENEHFPCTVGLPEMLAPELQSVGSVKNGIFSKQSDYFSLAIHIFRLLMNNEDPFGGIITTGESLSTIAANHAICNGECPYVRKIPGRSIPPHAPLPEILPPDILNLFKKTFDYTAVTALQNISRRATAKEWCLALVSYGTPEPNHRLKTCSVNPKHVYPSHNKECPWCKIDEPETAAAQSQSYTSRPVTSSAGSSAKKRVSAGMTKTVASGKTTPAGGSSRRSSVSRRSKKKSGIAGAIAAFTIGLLILVAIVCGLFYHYDMFGFKDTVSSGIEWLTEQLSPNNSAENAENTASEYIIPDSSQRFLSEEDLNGMSETNLALARNEIFARHGRIFETDWIREHFENTSWYNGIYEPEDFDNNLSSTVFNEYEKANINLIKSYEEKLDSQSS